MRYLIVFILFLSLTSCYHESYENRGQYRGNERTIWRNGCKYRIWRSYKDKDIFKIVNNYGHNRKGCYIYEIVER